MMQSRKHFTPPVVGGSSLLVIFAVLCLTVFTLLALSTVRADNRLSDASVKAVSDYYAADMEAEIICIDRDFNRLGNEDDKFEKEVEANYFAACLLMPLNLLTPIFCEFMKRNNRTRVLYVDTQQCNYLDYKQCIRTLQLYFLASESAIRYRLVNLKWMQFNIHFEPTVDRGISIAEYLQRLHQN